MSRTGQNFVRLACISIVASARLSRRDSKLTESSGNGVTRHEFSTVYGAMSLRTLRLVVERQEFTEAAVNEFEILYCRHESALSVHVM